MTPLQRLIRAAVAYAEHRTLDAEARQLWLELEAAVKAWREAGGETRGGRGEEDGGVG